MSRSVLGEVPVWGSPSQIAHAAQQQATIKAKDVEIARLRAALSKIATAPTPPEEHGHYLAHRAAVKVARDALKPGGVGTIQAGDTTNTSQSQEPAKQGRGRPSVDIATRMAALTEVDSATGCHVWRGTTLQNGYGVVSAGQPEPRKRVFVHRVAFTLAKGEIPPGLEIDHLCRNRRCCNPDHLEAVTHAVNKRRAHKTGSHFDPALYCAHGHPATPENTILQRGGKIRRCAVCVALKEKALRAKRRAAANPNTSGTPQ